MDFDSYKKINRKLHIRDNEVCLKVFNNIKKDIKIKLIKNDEICYCCRGIVFLCFNTNNEVVWHEIGHMVFDNLDDETIIAFQKALFLDIKSLGENYKYKQGVLSDAYSIIKEELPPGWPDASANRKERRAWVTEKRGYQGHLHEIGYGRRWKAYMAATETFAELFSCLFEGKKGNQKLPNFTKLFKATIGNLATETNCCKINDEA